MLTRDDVPHDRRLPGSIIVQVDEIRTNPKPRRDAELTVTDVDGAALRVIIWETHKIDQSWEVGATYELTGARGKRYSKAGDTTVEAHSTKSFIARQVTTNDATRVLVIGDTHVGYRHRASSNKPTWARNVDARKVFVRCLKQARELNVDSVIHVGDVFDHKNTQEDRNAVRQAILQTINAGITFYYIFGNHDNDKAKRLLKSTPGIHLAEAITSTEESSVNLLGVDHCGESFPSKPPNASIDLLLEKNILVIHESPHPVVDDSGSLLYQDGGDRANLAGFVDAAHFGIDLVVTGHLHVAKQASIQGYDIPVLVTGPTIPISQYEKDSNPSTWLLTVTSSEIGIIRQPV